MKCAITTSWLPSIFAALAVSSIGLANDVSAQTTEVTNEQLLKIFEERAQQPKCQFNVYDPSQGPRALDKITCTIDYAILPIDGREAGIAGAPQLRTCDVEIKFRNPKNNRERTKKGSCLLARGANSCNVSPRTFAEFSGWIPLSVGMQPKLSLTERRNGCYIYPAVPRNQLVSGCINFEFTALLAMLSQADISTPQTTLGANVKMQEICSDGQITKTFREIFKEISDNL